MHPELHTSLRPHGPGVKAEHVGRFRTSQATSTGVLAEPKPILRWLFYAFVFTIPFETAGVGEGGTAFTITKLIGYFLVLASFLQPRLCYRQPSLAFWCFVGYLWVCLCLALLGEPKYIASIWFRLFTLLQMAVFFWISYNLLRRDTLARAALVTFVSSCLLLALLQSLGITVATKGERISALGDNPNAIGSILALGLLAGLGLAYGQQKSSVKARLLAIPICAVVGYEMVRTGSRGAFVALAAGILLYILHHGTVRVKIRNACVVVFVLCVLVWNSYTWETARERWKRTFEYGSMAGRERIYPTAWSMFLEKPLQGWGPVHNMVELGGRVHFGRPRDTHNLFLHVLTETGILGAVPYFMGIWLCWRAAWRARTSVHGVLPLALLLCVLFINLSLTWHHRKLHWLVLAYAAASGSYMITRRSGKQPESALPSGRPYYSRYRYVRPREKVPQEAG